MLEILPFTLPEGRRGGVCPPATLVLHIEEINTQTSLQVKKESAGWIVSCEKSVQQIDFYNASGVLLKKTVLNGAEEYVIPYQEKVTFCIMRVLLTNGEKITVKF